MEYGMVRHAAHMGDVSVDVKIILKWFFKK
jgi:hypothetical protein